MSQMLRIPLINQLISILMKNCLELEITNLLRKANRKVMGGELLQSIQMFDAASNLYHENRLYNQSVSPHFLHLIFSLKGLAYLLFKDYESAEFNFNKSLQLNPYDYLTRARKTKLYYETNRLAEALEEVQWAYVEDPQGKHLAELTQLLRCAISQISDQDEKQRLEHYLEDVTKNVEGTENQNDNTQDPQPLNFCQLKKIDRVSFSKSNTEFKPNFFDTGKLFQKAHGSDKIMNSQSLQLESVEIIRKASSKKRQKQENYRKFNSINLGNGDENCKSPDNGQDSLKSIELKLSKRTSVVFIDSLSQRSKQMNETGKRKSCLKISKLGGSQIESKNEKRVSNFLLIKNIDGCVLRGSLDLKDISNNQRGQEQQKDDHLSSSHSDSDSNSSSHNEDSSKHRSQTSKVLQHLQNLKMWSGKKIGSTHEKKLSILKKDSIIGSQKRTSPLRKISHKKSVCFEREGIENVPQFAFNQQDV